ncbi:MAG: hypothetical protein ACHQE6_10275 [Solirubrobacterales bacterium]
MDTLLADPPAASGTEQPASSGGPPTPPVPPEGAPQAATPAQVSPEARTCAHCGAPLQEGQQWCLQCGACEPGSLGERPNWRPLVALGLAATLLAAGAVVAGAAALDKHNSTKHPAVVALVPGAPKAATPTATTPATPSLPATPGGAGGTSSHSSGKGSGGLLFPPSSTAKPPKIPAPVPTPNSGGGSGSSEPTGSTEPTGSGGESGTGSSEKGTGTTGTSTSESKSSEGAGKSEKPNPILLDTDAASTYNPSNYPAAGFGDPALAIDGEPSTAWTAQVQASSFPNMAEGLLIDLRSPTKLASLELATPTRGMTVQVYGAKGAKAPALIVDPGWTPLSGSHVLKKKVTHLKLRTEGRAYRRIVVWITKAPPASQGTAQAPGHVALSEVALYPPAS